MTGLLRLIFLLPAALLLASCSDGGGSRSMLQSDAAEAVFRKVFADCPRRAEAKIAAVTIGANELGPASPDFEKRFKDLGIPVVSYHRLNAGSASGLIRVYDPATGHTPLHVHLKSLDPAPGKTDEFEALASWAWKEDAASARYKVVKTAAGPFEVTKVEDIPVPKKEQR